MDAIERRNQRIKGPEQQEGKPKVVVDFFFAPHGTAEDMHKIRDLFNQADVYIPEIYGWSEKSTTLLKNIAEGREGASYRETAVKRIQREINAVLRDLFGPSKFYDMRHHSELESELLYNSKKAVALIDVPKTSPQIQKDKRREELMVNMERKAQLQFLDGNYDAAVDVMKKLMEYKYEEFGERNTFIAHELQRLLPTLRNRFPQLKEKKKSMRSSFSAARIHLSVMKCRRQYLPQCRLAAR